MLKTTINSRWVFVLFILCKAVFGQGGANYKFEEFSNGSSVVSARGINDTGHVVGTATDVSGQFHAFSFINGTFKVIDVAGSNELAGGINNADQVVGEFVDPALIGNHGFLLDLNTGVMLKQIDFPTAIGTGAFGINNRGDIVGEYTDSTPFRRVHGFLLKGGGFQTIDPPHSVFSQAFDINDSGQIVGIFEDPLGNSFGFLFDGVTYTTIHFPGSQFTFAQGINNKGQIVGEFDNGSFIFSDGSYTFLNGPTTDFVEAFGINTAGQIVGDIATTRFGLFGFIASPPVSVINLAIASTNPQNAPVNSAIPLVIKVSDQSGLPVPGISITFSITQQPLGAVGTTLNAFAASTASDGTASTQLTLGNKSGQYLITASCPSQTCTPNTVTFIATAVAPTFSITDLQLPIGSIGPNLIDQALHSPVAVQVVFNPHLTINAMPDDPVDLVLGKVTAFLVGLKVDDITLVSTPVTVEVEFDGIPLLPVFVSQTCQQGQPANCFNSDGTAIALVNSGFIPPRTAQNLDVTAVVNPAGPNHIPEGDGSLNGKSSNVNVNVHATSDLRLAYIRVDGCDKSDPSVCYGLLSPEATASVSAGNNFIRSTYPIADSVTLGDLSSTSIRGSSLRDPTGVLGPFDFLGLQGMLRDMHNVHQAGLRLTPPPKRVIGIVPKNYFAYRRRPDLSGVTRELGASVSLVVEGTDAVAAHELGHQLRAGLPEEYLTAHAEFGLPGNPAAGFWVAGNQFIDKGICFMGNQLFFNNPTQVGKTWVDNNHYEFFFNQLTQTSSDPEILLIGAIVHKNGKIDLLQWTHFDAGFPTPNLAPESPDDYIVQIADAVGGVVEQRRVSVTFPDIADPVTFSTTSVDISLISTAVPYPNNATSVSIIHRGRTIAMVNITSKLLSSAISSIPAQGFRSEPDEHRRGLLEEVGDIDQELREKDLKGAIGELRELKKKIEHQLVDDFQTQSPLEFNKGQILSLMDQQIQRLRLQLPPSNDGDE